MFSRNGLTIGAAAFVVGMSLAGPQVATAFADSGNDSATLSPTVARIPSPAGVARASRTTAGPQPAAARKSSSTGAASQLAGRTRPVSASTVRLSIDSSPRIAAAVQAPRRVGAVAAPVASIPVGEPARVAAARPVLPSFDATVAYLNQFLPAFVSNPLLSVQTATALAFNSLREGTNALLPPNVATVINDTLFLVRRLLLPTGKDVGLFGDAPCFDTGDCSGKDLTSAQFDTITQDILIANAVLKLSNIRGLFLDGLDSGSSLDLSGADLGGSTVTDMDLAGANLSFVNMLNAYVFGTDLSNANLSNAYLFGASIFSAGADNNVTGARFSNTVCPNGTITSTGCTA